MSARTWAAAPGMRAALVALAAAAAVAGWTLIGAFRVDPIPDPPAMRLAGLETAGGRTPRPRVDVGAVVDNDLFAADRSAPAARYRMPGEADANDAPAAQPEKPLLLGTVVATDRRSFATVQLGGGRPTLVRVGDKIGEWAVRAIERGKIVLVTATGARADVTVPKPGS